MASKVINWYEVPASIIESAKQNGKRCPVEIGLRAVTGDDYEAAITSVKEKASFRTQLMIRALAGVNYSMQTLPANSTREPAIDEAGRKECFMGAGDPDLIPSNIYMSLPGKMLVLLEQGFARLNDAREDEVASFLNSRKTVAATE